MFNSKKSTLFSTTGTNTSGSGNSFISKSLKTSAKTNALGNGATKYTTTGNDFIDQFGKITNYRQPRNYKDIHADMSLLWSQNPLLTLCLTFYIRMITRVVQLWDGVRTEKSQIGQGLKHEGIFRMMWIHLNAPESFWKNAALFIAVGSWKDIITMLSYDLQYNGWNDRKLNWTELGKLILAGLENPNTSELVKKYLPQIKSNTRCKTLEAQADNIIAKWICSLLFGGKVDGNDHSKYKQYRQLKSSGTAHTWQQLISQGKHLEINFDTVHGRALSQLVSGKYLKNRGLENKYQEWIASKPVAKFTGYAYELFTPLGTSTRMSSMGLESYQKDTINKQFYALVEKAKAAFDKNDNTNRFIGVLDTSGSMTSLVPGTSASAYSVGKSLTLFMSYLLEGTFANHYLEFSNKTIMKTWKGDNPVDQLCNDNSSIIAGTNFQSITVHWNKMLRQGINENEFPTGIVCFSDGCFNSTRNTKTNFKTLLYSLRRGGFSEDYVSNFKVILWDIPNGFYGKSQTAFEDFADAPNLFHVSGLDGSALAFLTGATTGATGAPQNTEELFAAAMNQEVLNMVQV